jgi:hypothetical protein
MNLLKNAESVIWLFNRDYFKKILKLKYIIFEVKKNLNNQFFLATRINFFVNFFATESVGRYMLSVL